MTAALLGDEMDLQKVAKLENYAVVQKDAPMAAPTVENWAFSSGQTMVIALDDKRAVLLDSL